MLFNQFINRKQSRFELVLENQTIDILGFTKPAGIVTVNLVRLSFTSDYAILDTIFFQFLFAIISINTFKVYFKYNII